MRLPLALHLQTRTGWGIRLALIIRRRGGSALILTRTIPWRSGRFGWG